MSKSSAHRHRRKPGASAPASRDAATGDGRVYIAITIIGLALIPLSVLLGEGWTLFGPMMLLFVGIIAWFVNVSAWMAYRGRPMARWKQSLARLPLRCVGYGTKGGKPLEAAHDVPAVRSMVVVSIVVSLALIGGLAAIVVPRALA